MLTHDKQATFIPPLPNQSLNPSKNFENDRRQRGGLPRLIVQDDTAISLTSRMVMHLVYYSNEFTGSQQSSNAIQSIMTSFHAPKKSNSRPGPPPEILLAGLPKAEPQRGCGEGSEERGTNFTRTRHPLSPKKKKVVSFPVATPPWQASWPTAFSSRADRTQSSDLPFYPAQPDSCPDSPDSLGLRLNLLERVFSFFFSGVCYRGGCVAASSILWLLHVSGRRWGCISKFVRVLICSR